MKKILLLSNALLACTTLMAQNSFHFNSRDKNSHQDIGVSSGVLTFGQFVNNCNGQYPENIEWKKILVGIGTPDPTEQLHTTQGVRFEGLGQDNSQTQVVVQDANGKLYWRDASTIGSGGGPSGNFWSLTGNAIGAGSFMGTTNNMDVLFKRNNGHAGSLGIYNTSFGLNALNPAGTGLINTAVGANALSVNTTGQYNTAHGYGALQANTDGYNNTATGAQALNANTSGNYNTATGIWSMVLNTTGYANTATGFNALSNNSSGINNTASGGMGLQANTTGNYNTACGNSALVESVSGNNNTGVGFNTGRGIITGSANTIIGANVGAFPPLPAGLSNTVIIADGDGKERLYVNSTGQAGLATTAPTAALHVNCGVIPLSGPSNVRFENLQPGAGNILVIDANGYVMRASSVASKMAQPDIDILKEELDNTRQELAATKQDLAELKARVAALLDAKSPAAQVADNAGANSLEIVPTPFSTHAKAVYTIGNFKGSAALQIVDAKGALLKTIPLTEAKGEVAIGQMDISSGAVFFNIIADGQTIISRKSVKQ